MGKILSYTFAILILAGCVASGKTYSEFESTTASVSSDKSRIYFLRESAFLASGTLARLEVNSIRVAELPMNGFAYVDVDPGATNIRVDEMWSPGEWRSTITFDPGKSYYLLVTPNSGKVMAGAFLGWFGSAIASGGIFNVFPLPDSTGREMIRSMKFVSNATQVDTHKYCIKSDGSTILSECSSSGDREITKSEYDRLKNQKKDTATTSKSETEPSGDDPLEAKLEKLQKLLDKGLITEEEAAAKRAKILEDL